MGALRFATGRTVTIPTGMTGNVGTSTYSFRIRSGATGITLPATGIAGFFGGSGSSSSNGLIVNASGELRVYSAGANRYGSGSIISSGVQFDFTVNHLSGGGWTITNNLTSSAVASGTFTTSSSWGGGSALNQMGRSSSTNAVYLVGDMEIIAAAGLVNAEEWVADLSGGSGLILPTTSGTNNGTLAGFPGDGSDTWIGFGATVSASIAATMPQMSATIAGSVIAPTFSASIAFSMPQMQVAAASSVIAPEFESSISFSMPQLSVDASAFVVNPSSGAVVAFTMPQMTIDAAASSAVPVFSASAVFAMPQFAVAASANVPSLNVTASVAAIMPQMSVIVSADVSNPAISAAISFTMPQMAVTAYTGGFAYFESDDANIETPSLSVAIETASLSTSIELTALSTGIEYVAQSRHLEYITQSRHIEWRA